MKLRPLLLLSACLAGAARLWAQAPADLDIRPRMAYEFQTTAGQAYLIEGSANGQTWTPVADPIFGDGQMERAVLPAAAGQSYSQFRVRPVSAASFLPATTALGGKTISLNDHGQAKQLIFFPSIQGVTRGFLKTDANRARSFVWTVQQVSARRVTVSLQFFDGSTSRVDLQFSNGVLGSYEMRDRSAAGQVQGTEAGAFSVHNGRIRDNPGQAVLPAVLIGQSLGFEEGGELTRMDFTTNNSVTVTGPDGSVDVQSYTYEVISPGVADLRVDRPAQPQVPPMLFQLALNSQATGNFNRFPISLPGGDIVPGVLPQPGVFNVPTGPVVSNSVTGPPKSLDGKTIQMGGDDPVTLTFNSDGTGTATREDNGSVEVTPFTYDYSPTDDDEASLALTFPGAQNDRVEDYDLDFSGNSSGSYQSNTYQGGELANSSSGNFNAG